MKSPRLSMNAIAVIVADVFGIGHGDLFSKRRPENITLPRQVAMFCMREEEYALSAIGRYFSKDHGTVMHACRSIKGRRDVEPNLREQMLLIEHELEETRKGLVYKPRAVRAAELVSGNTEDVSRFSRVVSTEEQAALDYSLRIQTNAAALGEATRKCVLQQHTLDSEQFETLLGQHLAWLDGLATSFRIDITDAVKRFQQNYKPQTHKMKLTLDDLKKLENLTPKQMELLKLLGEGHSAKELARLHGISIKTVETHQNHLKERLNLSNICTLRCFAAQAIMLMDQHRIKFHKIPTEPRHFKMEKAA